ncbi:centrosomal protein of 120 kDa [Copidosoma floridanum]|uniref:centrosomal protein of 120 kDa n=1 Tax=Copidosoma floridanum TaxID=29053 RepID=UPI000C6F9500|nr:centrosomal protein of 120 kDa [Copidosoma floridanum]
MENFVDQNLNLVLGVKEGCHFDRVQKPTVVLATLNGQCLETKKFQSDCNPQYATDLTWETDKNALRKMRCNSTPIKVECYAVHDNGSREKLGYILLSVRCAQIIHQGEDSKIKMNWHTILGVRNEFSNCKPKLMLYLIIRERDAKPAETAQKLQDAVSINSNIIPKWLQDEHLIQLGALDTCHDVFLLHITAETLTNLGQIKQESRESNNNDLTLIYNIFEMFFKLKSFKLESDSIYLNQKIVIKIRSSISVLANYLNSKSHFFVKLKYNNVAVAQSEISLQSLLDPNYLQNMKQINKYPASAIEYRCVLKNIHSKESKGDYKKDENEESPSLNLNIKLLLMESKESANDKNILLPNSSQTQFTVNDHHLHNSQEQTKNPSVSVTSNRLPYISSSDNVIGHNQQNVHGKKHSVEVTNIYRNFCLNLIVKSITFNYSKPDIKKIEFRFYTTRGDVIAKASVEAPIEAEKTIELQDVKCNLHFVSTSDKIEEVLSTFAPKINICDCTSDERKCLAQIAFDAKKLFDQQKPECQYTKVLRDCNLQNEIGFMEIFACLEDCTISVLKKTHEETSGTMFNNDLAYKIIDELETWKERQKELFRDELRKKEEAHLTLLNEEWQRRRQCLESKVALNIQQCKVLADNLSKTIEDLRKRKIQSFERETKLIQTNEELQWKHERKLRQLQDALDKMQAEFDIKLRTLEEQNRSLIRQIELLNTKNYELEKVKTEQSEKLSTFKKASLSEDQTTSILQQLKNLEEKLDGAQKSKKFFKEQWDNAVMEIHKLKTQNQRALVSQIQSSKEELHNFDLEEILHADSAALTYDQIALNAIQRELDVIKPRPSNRRYARSRSQEKLLAPHHLSLDYNLVKSDLSSDCNASEK